MSHAISSERTAGPKRLAFRSVSTVGVIGLVAGVPVVLIGAGATPPLVEMRRLLIHPAQLQHVLTGRFSDDAIAKLVWSIAWLVWAWFVACVALEIVARIRGSSPSKVPGSRHIQSLVTYLVGASLAFGPPIRQASSLRLEAVSASAPWPHHTPRTVGAPFLKRSHAAIVISKEGLTPGTTASMTVSAIPERIYVVRPRDTLWSIAAAELGSPLGWREIADANYGRPQPDGEELTNDHWIRPGWLLVIPTLATTPPPETQAQPSCLVVPAPPATVSVQDPVTPTAPATTSMRGSVESPTVQSAEASRPRVTDANTRAPVTHRGSSAPHLPVLPIGYGLLGAGIVALLDRMRRAQQRLRPTGLRIALPEGDLVELERGLRIAADPGSADWIDLTLRLLSVTVRRGGLATPAVSAVRLRDDVVEIMLDSSSNSSLPPPPFEPGPDGKSWVLTKSGNRLDALRNDSEVVGIDAPLPSLVTLGRDELGILMVNLEKAGSVAVWGAEADPLIQAIAVELATAQWTDQIDLVLVGFGEKNEALERVSHASSLRAVGARMERRVRERAALLALVDRATNTETRWLDGGDAWDLCVVVCSPSASADESDSLDALIKVAGDGSLGVAVICGCDVISSRWRVRADGGRVSIEGAGRDWSSLSRQPVPPNFAEGVAALVSVAAQTSGVTANEGPYENLSRRRSETVSGVVEPISEEVESRDNSTLRPVPPIQATILVRVLGPVEITGAARQFTRAWAIELIVYLAMHPGGVSNEQWATALWPDKEMAPASLHSTASAARRSLGTSNSEADHLPRSRGRLALGPEVRTDWDEFVDLSQSSIPDDWRRALAMIHGRPFDGLRSPDWVVLEGILATVEAVVVDLACRYAEYCLVLDARGAEWAARQGLRVSPYDERLYRVLLKASDAAGNPAGVESIMAELVHLVADDVEPFDAVHPETLALYRRLSRRSFVSRTH